MGVRLNFSARLHLLRFDRELRNEQAILAAWIRDRRKITTVLFQGSGFLFSRRRASFHAALGAPNTDSDHVAGIIRVHVIGRLELVVAVGAGEGRIL
jgi:hypothetical protein